MSGRAACYSYMLTKIVCVFLRGIECVCLWRRRLLLRSSAALKTLNSFPSLSAGEACVYTVNLHQLTKAKPMLLVEIMAVFTTGSFGAFVPEPNAFSPLVWFV